MKFFSPHILITVGCIIVFLYLLWGAIVNFDLNTIYASSVGLAFSIFAVVKLILRKSE